MSTLRLIQAAIKDRDISLRETQSDNGCADEDVRAILTKMIDQRHGSIQDYCESGRLELAEQERGEVSIIKEFLPKPLSDNEAANAVSIAIEKTGAASIRDLGRVMTQLQSDFAGRIDLGKIGCMVKEQLG